METTDSVNIQVWITGLIALSAYIGLVWQFIVSNRIRKQEVDRDNFTRDTTQNTQILSFFQFLRDYQSEINRLNNLLSKTETTVFRCHEFLDSLEESSLTKAQKAISRSEVTKKIDDLCTLRSEARQHLALESNDVLKQVKALSKIGNEHLDLQQLIKLYLNSFAAWIHANGLCESVEEIRLLTESALDIQIKLTGIDEEKNELKRAIRVELAERKEAIPEEMVARLKEFGIDCGQNEVNSEKKGQPKD